MRLTAPAKESATYNERPSLPGVMCSGVRTSLLTSTGVVPLEWCLEWAEAGEATSPTPSAATAVMTVSRETKGVRGTAPPREVGELSLAEAQQAGDNAEIP